MNTVLTIGSILSLILFMGLIVWTQSKRRKISAKDHARILTHWKKVVNEQAQDPKAAILEADKVLDEVLRLKGFTGSLGEKLKKAESLFSQINEVWNAHKLRNRIAHELNLSLEDRQVRQALQAFEKGLKDLGIKW